MIRRSPGALGTGALVAVLALAVFGAGATTASAAPAPASATTVVLTNSSNGVSVIATKGERVVVKLTGGRLRWSEAQAVQSDNTLVLVSGTTSTTGSSRTVFRVANYGVAEIDATGTPICSATTGCPQYVVLWHATVIVPVVDPPPSLVR